MPRPIKVLLVEDNPHDCELILRGLQQAGFEPAWQRVETEGEYRRCLAGGVELVLSDYAMPEFDGMRALAILQELGLDVPFILISGTIGEDVAVTAMKQGAADYLIKDRLARLGQAVSQALEQSRLRHERRAGEQAVRDNAIFVGEVLDSLTASLVVLDEHGTIKATNEAWRRFARLNGGGETQGLNYLSACLGGVVQSSGPETRAAYDGIRGVLDGTLNYFTQEYACEGPAEKRWYVMRVSSLSGSQRGAVVTQSDITARRQAEEAARTGEERFRQLIENGSDIIAVLDAGGFIRYHSPSTPRVLGYQPEELSGKQSLDFVHPDDRTKVFEAVQRVLQGQTKPTPLEYRTQHRDGTWRLLQSLGKEMTGPAGEKLVVVNSRDITESRLLEQKFLRAQRMEAIGTLSSGVAHDLNNILAPMLMVPGLLRSKLADPRDREILGMVEQGAQRGANIIAQLLTFSRGVEGARVNVQIRHLIKEMIQIMRETFPRNLTISDDIQEDLWVVLADATQLHQVLMNLCVNARDAMPTGGKLTIGARNAQLTAADVQAQPTAQPGAYVVLSVVDTGQGIPADIVERIFDPFFTTKEIGKGTGLGLSTVLGIVKSHDGFVTVHSEPGRGTVFRVHLPAAMSGPTEAIQAPAGAVVPLGNNELILVVDDERPIRDTVRQLLQRYGYRVSVAESGEEAIQKFIQQREAVRLVFTDLMMPGMGGLGLIRALRGLKSDIPVIASSGLGSEEAGLDLAELGVAEVLAKPFSPTEILKAIDRLLTKAPRPD